MKRTILLTLLLAWSALPGAYPQEKTVDGKTDQLTIHAEGGVLAGNSDNLSPTPFIFHTSLNYAFGGRLSAGVGTGVEFLEETHLPVTANVMYLFGNRAALRTFARLQAGYLIALESRARTTASTMYYYPSPDYYYGYRYSIELDAQGGWMFNPSVGVIFYTKQKTGIALSAGYRYQALHYEGKDDYRMQVEYNRLSLTLGIIF